MNISYLRDIFENFVFEEKTDVYIVKKIEEELKKFVDSGFVDNGFIVVFENNNISKMNKKDENFAEIRLITKSGVNKIENFIVFDSSMNNIIVNRCIINSFLEDEFLITEKELGKKITKILIRCPLILKNNHNKIGYYGISKFVNIFDAERTISNFNDMNNRILQLTRK